MRWISCLNMLNYRNSVIKNVSHRAVFELHNSLKAKLKGVLTGFVVAMVIYYGYLCNNSTCSCRSIIWNVASQCGQPGNIREISVLIEVPRQNFKSFGKILVKTGNRFGLVSRRKRIAILQLDYEVEIEFWLNFLQITISNHFSA